MNLEDAIAKACDEATKQLKIEELESELNEWKRWCKERERALDDLAKAFSQQQDRIKRLEEALTWYESKVSDCNRRGPEGDAARDALAKDLGHKAKEAKP